METKPIMSMIAYLKHKRSKSVISQTVEVNQHKDLKISHLSSTVHNKQRAPLINRFQRSCSELFSKVSNLQSFIQSLELQLKQLNMLFTKSFREISKLHRQQSVSSNIQQCHWKIQNMLSQIKQKISIVYSIEDSKQKVTSFVKDISIRVDQADNLERKLNKQNITKLQIIDINLPGKISQKFVTKHKQTKVKREKEKHYSSVNY